MMRRVEAVRRASWFAVVLGLALLAGRPAAAGGDLDLPIAPGLDPLDITVEANIRPVDPEADAIPFEEDPAVVLYDEEIPVEARSIIFVIDTSGSMCEPVGYFAGLDGTPTTGTRLDRAKVELVRAILALGESYAFTVHAYSCTFARWSPSRRPATPENKASAVRWVLGLQALGGTGTGPALAVALADRENKTIVLLTDGAPGCGGNGDTIADHLATIQANNVQRASIHGFGIGATGVFEQFLRDVAAASGGTYHPVR